MKTAVSNKISSLTTVLAVSLLVMACTPKEVPIAKHEGAIPTEEVVYAPKGPAADAAAFAKFDVTGASKKYLSVSSSGGLKELEQYMLFSTYIEDPKFVNGESGKKLTKILEIWNRAVLSLLESQPNDASTRALVDKYMKVIRSGCSSDLKGCVNIAFFRRDPGTARVLEAVARGLETELAAAQTDAAKKTQLVRAYYFYLSLAFDLRNRVANQEFEFLYLNRANDYAEVLAQNDSAQTKPDQQRHAEIFEMIMNDFNPDMSNPVFKKRVEQFVENFSPWTYSRRLPNTFGVAASKIIGLAAQNFLYQSNAANAPLHPQLAKAIAESQADSKKPGELTFDQIVAALRQQNPKLFETLALDESFPRDEYFFMIDRLFGDHLTADDVSEIWSGSRKNATRFLKTLEQYLKIQIAWLIVGTNDYMSKIYASQEYTGNTMVQNAVQQAYPITSRWQQTISKISRIAVFVNRHMKRPETEQQDPDFVRIENMLTSLGRNIKYISVYPNMMLMTYFMEQSDGTLPIYTFWGQVDLPTVTVITAFFSGKLSPFLNFGNDGEKLKRLETLYAFYFALKTDTFKAFNVNEKMKVDEISFFEKVIGKYLAEDKKALLDAKQDLVNLFSGSTTHATFLSFCEQDHAALQRREVPGKTGVSLPIEFREFPYVTYMGADNMGQGQSATQFYTDSLATTVKEKMSALRTKLVFVDSMIRILDNHLEKTGVDAAVRANTIAKIRANISKVTDVQAEFMTELYNRHLEISKCYTQSLKIEWDRQQRLLEKEEQYLRDVYRSMKKEREPEFAAAHPDVLPLSKIAERYPLTLPGDQLPAGFQGAGNLTADELFYSELDVLLRLRVFMKEIAPKVTILLPTDLTDTELWKTRRQSVLPATVTEDEFVARGLRNFGNRTDAYVKWMSSTNSLKPLNARIKLLAELLKIGEFEVFKLNACTEKTDLSTCPKEKTRVTPKEVVDEYASLIALMTLSKKGQAYPKVRFFDLIGMTRQFDRFQLEEFFLDSATVQGRTLMDALYQMVTDDQDALKEARDYFATASTLGHFMFTPDDSVAKTMRKAYRPLVLNSFKIVDDLEAAIHEREKQDKGDALELGHLIQSDSVVTMKAELDVNDVPVYLAKRKRDDFITKKALFHKETRDFFKAQEGDEDYVKEGGK